MSSSMKFRARSRSAVSIGSNQLSKSRPSTEQAAAFMLSFVMAWSPVRRSNAGIRWVETPGDYATQIPTTPATPPIKKDRFAGSLSKTPSGVLIGRGGALLRLAISKEAETDGHGCYQAGVEINGLVGAVFAVEG